MANGTSKNVGLRKFWRDLEISEAFLISLEVSFFHVFFFTFFESRNVLPKSLGLGFLTRISVSRRVSDFTIRHPLNTNERLKCNRKDLSTICSYRSLQNVGYVPLYTVRKSLFGIPATGI